MALVLCMTWEASAADVRQFGQAAKVIELPYGNKVTITPGKDGAQVIELPRGRIQYLAIWRQKMIPVCWENPDATALSYRDLVKSAVLGSWQKESQLQFTGWGKCDISSLGIRIMVADAEVGPHVEVLGRYLDGRPAGMVLNFTFEKWSPFCQSAKEFCIWGIAVHEFGHAIGFAHEQNRSDAPFECQTERVGTNGDWNLTTYDPDSVMNYCNVKYNNNGILSSRDIQAVRMIYGTP